MRYSMASGSFRSIVSGEQKGWGSNPVFFLMNLLVKKSMLMQLLGSRILKMKNCDCDLFNCDAMRLQKICLAIKFPLFVVLMWCLWQIYTNPSLFTILQIKMFESLLNFQPSRNNERFKPYITYTIKERRLGKLFYTPAKRTEDRNVHQEFTPKLKTRYPYMSMQDKLDRLKKLIGELPSNDYHQVY